MAAKTTKTVKARTKPKYQEIKRLYVWSVAKLQAILMAVIGFLLGLFYALLGVALGPAAFGESAGIIALGFWLLLLLPLVYGIMGLVGGGIGAALYNCVAKWVGGIKLQLK